MHLPTLRSRGAARAARPLHLAAAGALLAAAACAPAEPTPGDTAAADTSASAGAPAPGGAPAVADAACAGEGATVTGRGVGAVRLGMTADALRRACATTDTTFTLGEGIEERGLATRVVGSSVVALLGPGDSVTRILVREWGLTTPQLDGITSRLDAMRQRHPRLCALVGEGKILVAAPDVPGVSFVTDADFGQFAGAAGSGRANALPDSTRVTAIWVHGVEDVCGGRA